MKVISLLNFLRKFFLITFIGSYITTYLILKNAYFFQIYTQIKPTDIKIDLFKKYKNILNTIFRLLIGILLVLIQIPYFNSHFTINLENYASNIAPIIATSGVMVLFTISYEDLLDVKKLFKSLFTDVRYKIKNINKK
jgi:hypothetical protein